MTLVVALLKCWAFTAVYGGLDTEYVNNAKWARTTVIGVSKLMPTISGGFQPWALCAAAPSLYHHSSFTEKTSDSGAEFEEHTINKDLDGRLNNAKKQNIDFSLIKGMASILCARNEAENLRIKIAYDHEIKDGRNSSTCRLNLHLQLYNFSFLNFNGWCYIIIHFTSL